MIKNNQSQVSGSSTFKYPGLITKHLKDNKGKLYRKPIPIYKFGDNLKESDSLERQRCILILLFFYDLKFYKRLIV